ncbi:MAG: hypothetical protein LBV32_05410 [Tannerellaceae bacterium]|jgi:hypothetical protein|nr:hypothetical protein [Tannerellaceae bacterium]
MKIIKLKGQDKELYSLVGPLVMNSEVQTYNLNYPFKTGPGYIWFVAVDKESVVAGFMPVKPEGNKRAKINNYYVAGDNEEVFSALLEEIVCTLSTDYEIESITQLRHIPVFEKAGFYTALSWKKYVKMRMSEKKKEEEGADEKECI